MDVNSITLRAIASATEAEDRVKTALSLFLFGEEIETIKSEGHFGNPIAILQARIKGKNCSRFIELLKSKFFENELERLRTEVCDRVDDHCVLHVRFDKQAAYNGTVQLSSTSDTITAEIKLRVYPAKRDRAVAVAEKIF